MTSEKLLFTSLCLICAMLFLSCSKDNDLLSEYVSINQSQDAELIKYTVDDTYFMESSSSMVLDVLSNDNFYNGNNIKIIGVSDASNGVVVINENNTLTYTPNTVDIESPTPASEESSNAPEETSTQGTPAEQPTTPEGDTTDTFIYTTEVTTEENIINKEEATVTITTSATEMGELKAFPGAHGFGKNATGGRGGIVIEVTNLNDDGSGSLRQALKRTEKRTIVFKVGGTIDCKSYLLIPSNAGNVTIAGQTAPGDGITIKGAELRVQASNVIIRYLNIRPGDETSGSNEDVLRIIAYSGNRTENVIVDHCSLSWGKDENIEIGGIGDGSNVRNVTIQNCIIAENIKTKYGLLLWNDAKNISIYQNLFAHNAARNIRSSTCTSNFEMINNVVYGYNSATQPTYENQFDIIGNVYISNPNVSTSYENIRLEASLNNCPNGVIGETKAYISDNLFNGNSISVSSNLNPYIQSNEIFNSGISIKPVSEVLNYVLENVGNSIKRDETDTRIINDVINRTGSLKSSVASAGGYSLINTGSSYQDSDKDGMFDDWETSIGLDSNNASDGKDDYNDDGYTNLEEFLTLLTITN